MSRPSQAERRALVERILTADPSRSDRAVARTLGCSHNLVGTVRREMIGAGRIEDARVRPGPDARGEAGANGNHGYLTRNPLGVPGPATKSGCDSPTLLAPLRLQGEDWARARWPWLDEARIVLVGDLMSRVELARRWIEGKGTVVKSRSGEVFPVADRLDSWSKRLDELIVRLDADGREREATRAETLESYVATLSAGDGNGA